MKAATVAERLGGPALLGEELVSPLDWARALEEGFLPSSVDAVIAYGVLTREECERLVIPRRTLAHRRQKDQRLSLEESDRLLRVVRVTARAEEVFASTDKACRWLRKPSRAMEGAVPLELLRSGTGAEIVQEELVRIEHGIFL